MYSPEFRIQSSLLNTLICVTELIEKIKTESLDVALLSRLQHEACIRLAHSSTAIEGNPLSLDDVDALSRGDAIRSNLTAKTEVSNYFKALKGIQKLSPKSTVSLNNLMAIHRQLLKGLLSPEKTGRFKTRANRIVNPKGITIYTPPSPSETPKLTQVLIDWINGPSQALHPVIASAIAHHQLVSIHPFSDGNGRVARCLALLVLYRRGFDSQHILALDDYFEEDRSRYYTMIQQARDLDNDLTYWIDYVALGVLETLQRTISRIASLGIQSLNMKISISKRQEDLIRFITLQGSVSTSDIEAKFNISRARVNQLINPLVAATILTRIGQSRATTYRLN